MRTNRVLLLILTGCFIFSLLAVQPAFAEESVSAVPVTLNVNYKNNIQDTFYRSGDQLLADVSIIAKITRCEISKEGNKTILRHAGYMRVITLDPDKQTLAETNDGGDTFDSHSMKIVIDGDKTLVPAYLLLTYLGATVSFDDDKNVVCVDMPETTFWESLSFVFEEKMAVSQIDNSGMKLFLDNIVDFVNPGGKGVNEIISGSYKKDAIYAAVEADTLKYDSVKAAASKRTEKNNDVVESFKAWKTVASDAFDYAFLLDDARFMRIAMLDDKLDRMSGYIGYFDDNPFRDKVSEITGNVGAAVDGALLGFDIVNTVYERTNANEAAVKALNSTISEETLRAAANPAVAPDYLSTGEAVSGTLSSPSKTQLDTALEKVSKFLADKIGEQVIKKLAGGSGAIAFELGGIVAKAIGYSPAGKYTPFAEMPKAEYDRMAILAADCHEQTWKIYSGLGDKLIQEKCHNQDTLNRFYYSYLLLLRYSLIWHESGINYNAYAPHGEANVQWFSNRADAVAKAIYDLELCSVSAVPIVSELTGDAAGFDREVRESVEYGNTPGNIANGGRAAIKGGMIYYSKYSLDDGADDEQWEKAHHGLYKMRADGTGEEKLSDDGAVCINVIGDRIYYCDTSDGYKIYTMKTDGTDVKKLGDDRAYCLNVVGNRIYFSNRSDGGRIYTMRTDGDERKMLSEVFADGIIVVGDRIYYCNESDEDNLYTMKTDGTGVEKLSDDGASRITAVGDRIYYVEYSDFSEPVWSARLCSINIDGTGREILKDSTYSMSNNVADDWIYYSTFSVGDENALWGGTYSMRTDGTDDKRLSDDFIDNINVVGDWIYYLKYNVQGLDDGRLVLYPERSYIMRADGTDRRLLD